MDVGSDGCDGGFVCVVVYVGGYVVDVGMYCRDDVGAIVVVV